MKDIALAGVIGALMISVGVGCDDACGATTAQQAGSGGSGEGGSDGGGGGGGGTGGLDPTTVTLNSCGHAHNDYEHAGPLSEALAVGFCSVEVDIFLEGSALLVGHDVEDLDPAKTLEALYLDPLRTRIADGETLTGPHGEALVLLIDIKTGAQDTYAALDPVLASYGDVFTSFDPSGVVDARPVIAVISGNRPQDTIAAQPLRYAAIDGRIGKADSPAPTDSADLIPLVSQNWNALFGWNGTGTMPKEERALLQSLVAEAHGQNRWLRFWATPDDERVWDVLVVEQVDLINADDLAGLSTYLAQFD